MAEEVEGDGEAFAVGDEEGFVGLEAFEVGGDPALADPLGDRASFGLQLAGGVVTVERCAGYVGERDDDVAIAVAQARGNSGEGAAGSDRADEPVDLAVG